MSDSKQIIEPTETIQLPAPSWGPALLAFGIMGLLAGIFAYDFMFPPAWYAIVGAVFVIAAIRSMAKKGTRAYYSLPRDHGDVRSELPVESFKAPTHD